MPSHVRPFPSNCPECLHETVSDLGPCRVPVELKQSSISSDPEFSFLLEGTRLFRCKRCALVFRWPRFDDRQLATFYRKLSINRWDYAVKEVGSWNLGKKLLLRDRDAERPLQILDIGAFRGQFLSELPPAWEKSAIEPSEEAVRDLKAKHIQHIAHLLQDPLDEYKERFDIITMFDVFEHLIAPAESLKAIASLLRPGGIALISTGNAAHWSWKLLKGTHWYLHSMQHLSFGSPEYFEEAAKRVGLDLTSCIPHSHQSRTLREAYRQSVETLYMACRTGSPPYSFISKCWIRVPGFRNLAHLQHPPYATALNDHLMVYLTKPDPPIVAL